MSDRHRQVTPAQRSFGAVVLLMVLLVLIGNVAAYAWFRPYGIIRDLGVVADVREQLLTRYVEQPDDDAMIEAAIRGMVDSVGDEHTAYFNEEEVISFNEHVGGRFSGIGAEIDIHDERLRIVAPLEDSPAWRAGVMAGDIVLEIDGRDTHGISITEAQQQLKGEPGTTVTVRVRHPDGEIRDINITRGRVTVASVRGYRRDPGNGYHYMIDPDQQIAYVKLSQFGDHTVEELLAVLDGLNGQGMRGLILDLRNNGGGLLDAAVQITDLFLPNGSAIVSTAGRAEPKTTITATAQTPLPDLPLVLLVNEYSASASEILAGALQDNGRAVIVGTRTYGKGSVQQLLPLEGGRTALKVTTAYWYVPSGRLIHRVEGAEQWGVDPTPGDYVPMSFDEVEAMELRKRDNEADDPYQRLAGPITPAWISEHLLDKQLAAGLEAMQQRLAAGDWPTVGERDTAAQIEAADRDLLEQRRLQLLDLLEQVEQEIAELSADAGLDEPAAAPPAEEPEPVVQPAGAP